MSLVNFLTARRAGRAREMWVFLTLSRSGPASAPRRAVSRCVRRGRTPLATQLSYTRTLIIFYTSRSEKSEEMLSL